MASDFFDRQDYARRQTTRLLVMFGLSVVVIILAIYLVCAVIAGGALESGPPGRHGPSSVWDPVLLLWVALATGLVIGLGSLYKIAELSAGGETVALMLGGRAVNPQTRDLAERRLLNVVEEMALASGLPVPPVFVLDNEPSINAFAAGHRPADAVVAVSRGALEYLTREELQGVMGHEFSHILNGDMRLNLRLIGIVNGILVLAIIGYYIMRIAGSSSRSSSDSDKKGGAAAMVLIGLALMVLGYLGVFLGNIIKAAISRQREFLADASAVQFTRYPGGIAGALKKIGGLAEGSRIADAHAAEISHMFFGQALAASLFNLFATHPPLAARIRRLEPEFDGNFPEVEPVAVTEETYEGPARAEMTQAGAAPVMALDAGQVTRRIGSPGAEHLRHAARMVGGMPPSLLEAAREPFVAQAVVYALLLSPDDEATRARQLELLAQQIEEPLYRDTQQLAAEVQSLSPGDRLPMVDLTTAALKRFSPQQYARFRQVVEALIGVDGKVDLFEYCVRLVLFSYLDVHFGLKKPPAVRYQTVAAIARPAAIVLSSLAYAGQKRPEDIRRAFEAGAAELGGKGDSPHLPQMGTVPFSLLAADQCTFPAFDAALAELAQAGPKLKRVVVAAAAACIAADGKVTLAESELLRAIAAVLSCPIPPIQATEG